MSRQCSSSCVCDLGNQAFGSIECSNEHVHACAWLHWDSRGLGLPTLFPVNTVLHCYISDVAGCFQDYLQPQYRLHTWHEQHVSKLLLDDMSAVVSA